MRISTSGRVTIPKRIRDTMGLLPGTTVEFAVEGRAIRILPATSVGT
jgi:AbrB family looped-hinge helix DNA binding protein